MEGQDSTSAEGYLQNRRMRTFRYNFSGLFRFISLVGQQIILIDSEKVAALRFSDTPRPMCEAEASPYRNAKEVDKNEGWKEILESDY